MKTLVGSSTLLLALAALANAKPHHQLPPHKVAAKDVCLKKLGVTEDMIFKHDVEEGVNTRSCFFACMNKEIGLINAEGNIDREVALTDFPSFVPQENRTKIVDACYQQKGADDCETSDLYHNCVKKLKPRPPINPEFKKIHDSCKEKLGVTDEELHKMKHSGEEPKSDCFTACLGKGIGFLNEDGTFNKEVFVEKSPADKKEKAQKVVDECVKEVATDVCETAALLHKCFKRNEFRVGDFYPRPSPPTKEE